MRARDQYLDYLSRRLRELTAERRECETKASPFLCKVVDSALRIVCRELRRVGGYRRLTWPWMDW